MRRYHLVGFVVVIAALLFFNALVTSLLAGGCADAGCEVKCKVSNVWCVRIAGNWVGFIDVPASAEDDFCIKAGEAGETATIKLISWDEYSQNTPDCPAATGKTTGTVGGRMVEDGSFNRFTKCITIGT